MTSNILKAINNIIKNNEYDFDILYPPNSEIRTTNKIQDVGVALKYFIKDSFSNSFKKINKNHEYEKIFSYLGNANNPPDLMIKHGDAIEVKKMNGFPTEIQLNSSHPIQKLSINDSLITEECRNCEKWEEKDLIYAIGNFIRGSKKIKLLFFIYGDCYAASNELYQNFKNLLSHTIETIPNAESTNELGRINKIDNLGITKLRIRGMWLLKNPLYVFNDLINYDKNTQSFTLLTLMRKDKFLSFPKEDIDNIRNNKEILLNEVKIRNPDNDNELLDAIFIRYDKQ